MKALIALATLTLAACGGGGEEEIVTSCTTTVRTPPPTTTQFYCSNGVCAPTLPGFGTPITVSGSGTTTSTTSCTTR